MFGCTYHKDHKRDVLKHFVNAYHGRKGSCGTENRPNFANDRLQCFWADGLSILLEIIDDVFKICNSLCDDREI
ncbi:hypothetical protein NQ317_001841 [Molorchus minor]|uniref:Uncharacterized protein n=1 Tax=Molorchus minor TaxID=1323400 RepID=A0ABQ9JB14_9CUCU|nr:hypothetical protein NQ317_001841 [Molorchus minor]